MHGDWVWKVLKYILHYFILYILYSFQVLYKCRNAVTCKGSIKGSGVESRRAEDHASIWWWNCLSQCTRLHGWRVQAAALAASSMRYWRRAPQHQVLLSRSPQGQSVKWRATFVRLQLNVRTILYITGESSKLNSPPWQQQQLSSSVLPARVFRVRDSFAQLQLSLRTTGAAWQHSMPKCLSS